MARNAERLDHIALDSTPPEPSPDTSVSRRPQLASDALLQQNPRYEAMEWRQSLNPAQFATLDALARLLSRAAVLPFSHVRRLPFPRTPHASVDHRLGLDELDHITRTRAGYPFAEIPTDLQEAVLSLVASRDLTSQKVDLALWLEDLLHHPPSHVRATT